MEVCGKEGARHGSRPALSEQGEDAMSWKMIAGGAAAVLFLGVCVYLGGTFVDDTAVKAAGVQPSVPKDSSKTAPSPAKVKKDKTAAAGAQTGAKKSGLLKQPPVNASTNSIISADEKKALDELQFALDEENFAQLRGPAAMLAKSSSPEVRAKVVESLRWFKQKALPQLRSMMSDADPDVARQARDGWRDAAGEIKDESIKARELLDGMLTMTDTDALRETIMGFYELADSVALESLLKLINSGNPSAAAVARDGWEHVAGNSYTTTEAAQQTIDELKKNNPAPGSTP
jgi:hypothetical protein